tara:strand:- start:16 stop:435 length:420 start_codon:yes stop_codon:yes gene_type:complete
MSFILALTFNNIINESVQVGDIVYFTPLSQTGISGTGFENASTSSVIELGEIVELLNPDLSTGPIATIKILDNLDSPPGSGAPDPVLLPGPNDFIMFGKDKSVNTTSLVGYYAEVKFENNSTEKVELFSVGSEITESSK